MTDTKHGMIIKLRVQPNDVWLRKVPLCHQLSSCHCRKMGSPSFRDFGGQVHCPFGPDIVALVSNCWEGNNQTVGKETINLRLDPDEVQLHPTQEHPVSLVLGFQVVGDRRCIMPW